MTRAYRGKLRLKAVVDTAADGIILIDSDGSILMFNPACEHLFGYTAREVLGKNVKMLMPAPYRDEHDRYLKNYRQSGERKIIGIGREVVAQRKDGSTFPIDLSVGEAKEAGGAIFVGIIHDLTQRRRSDKQLIDSLTRMKAVLDTAADGVILIDAKGKTLMFNPACERLFGYTAQEVIGESAKILVPDLSLAESDRDFVSNGETGLRKVVGVRREVVGQRKDGTSFPIDLSIGVAEQDRQPVFVGIIRDLTDHKRTIAQLIQAQKMEAVGQLSGGIAHDFNNLLTVIVGYSETLSQSLKSRPKLRELSDAVLAAGERGAQLTYRLLAFGRRQVLQPVGTDCRHLIDDLANLLRRTLREDIEIEISHSEGVPPALVDPSQLESALLNLALNAQDAMPSGGHLTMTTAYAHLDTAYSHEHPGVKPGEYVVLSITDDGSGMPPEVLEHAFEPFYTTKEVGKGSGLGLSMVYGFVTQSNGHVSIYSEPGLGTTVRIYLPTATALSSSPASLPERPVSVPKRGKELVLVVEDDASVRNYAVASLKDLGYHVIAANSGRDALERLSNGARPDILFTDIVMPGGVSGLDLAARAQDLQPGLRVLFTSGYSVETLGARHRLHIANGILNKPYRKAELAQRIREVLDGPSH